MCSEPCSCNNEMLDHFSGLLNLGINTKRILCFRRKTCLRRGTSHPAAAQTCSKTSVHLQRIQKSKDKKKLTRLRATHVQHTISFPLLQKPWVFSHRNQRSAPLCMLVHTCSVFHTATFFCRGCQCRRHNKRFHASNHAWLTLNKSTYRLHVHSKSRLATVQSRANAHSASHQCE